MSVALKSNSVQFHRRLVRAGSNGWTPAASIPAPVVMPPIQPRPDQSELTVLVLNASQEMAKEITMQLTLAIPGCAITYAPTIALAKWILSRKKIGLIVASPILPDGAIARLKNQLAAMESQPDLLVVGDVQNSKRDMLGDSQYHVAEVRRFAINAPVSTPQIVRRTNSPRVEPGVDKIKQLGAGIRNDLNNPLQEIVAMVFVAQNSAGLSDATNSALQAIEGAAKNMAKVVSSLEDKIKGTLSV